tara:strand:+ start:20 stop:484 length:465 start_codon:yes stop_codon:yes gene_type:complete
MNYQGEQVNFSQVSDAQFQWVLGQIGKNTQNLYKIGNDTTYFGTKVKEIDGRLAINESNLVKMGNDMTQIGADNTTMGNAITRIDNAIKGVLQLIGTTNMAVKTNSDNLVQMGKSINQINKDHKNMGTGGGITQYIPLMAAGGIAAYLLKGKLK